MKNKNVFGARKRRQGRYVPGTLPTQSGGHRLFENGRHRARWLKNKRINAAAVECQYWRNLGVEPDYRLQKIASGILPRMRDHRSE